MKVLSKGEYYGALKSEQSFSGIVVSEYNYLTDKTDWHFHENPYLMYVLQGNLYDINKKRKSICPTGSLLLHNWQEPHFNQKESINARGFHVEFEREWFEEKQLNVDLWKGSTLIENPNLHHLLAKLYYEFKCQDKYSEASIEILLFQFCESLETDETYNYQEPTWVKELKDLLHQSTESFSLTSLSEKLGVHPGHISRAVPKYFSTTLGDYIRKEKVKRALNSILTTKKSFIDITYECGFSDQSHFIRMFKHYIGRTPKQFRSGIN